MISRCTCDGSMPAAATALGDRLGEVHLGDLAGRHVDGDRHRRRLREQVVQDRHLAARLAQHPGPDGDDQAGLLEDRDELRRRHRAPVARLIQLQRASGPDDPARGPRSTTGWQSRWKAPSSSALPDLAARRRAGVRRRWPSGRSYDVLSAGPLRLGLEHGHVRVVEDVDSGWTPFFSARAMPTEAEMRSNSTPRVNGRSTTRMIISASRLAATGVRSGPRMTNSSPPKRSTRPRAGRHPEVSRSATACAVSRSPASWPRVSLIGLKRSRSTKRRRPGPGQLAETSMSLQPV